MFNAATALGDNGAEMRRKVDSVMFCLVKGLGAPVGSMVLGTKAFIEKARVYRKMFGGGMRQAGVIAAAGLTGPEKSPGGVHLAQGKDKRMAGGSPPIPSMEVQSEEGWSAT